MVNLLHLCIIPQCMEDCATQFNATHKCDILDAVQDHREGFKNQWIKVKSMIDLKANAMIALGMKAQLSFFRMLHWLCLIGAAAG